MSMRYPWDRWMDGRERRLLRGVHFEYSDSLISSARSQARKSGGKLLIAKLDRNTVKLKYIPPKYIPALLPGEKVVRNAYWPHPQIKRFPNSRVDEMVELRETGMTYAQVGEHFGISRERVRQILAKNGLTFSLITTPSPDLLRQRREAEWEYERAVAEKRLKMRRFGTLRVIKRLDSRKAIVKCECGVEKEVDLRNLKNGRSTTCGMKIHYKRGWLPTEPPPHVRHVPRKYLTRPLVPHWQ